MTVRAMCINEPAQGLIAFACGRPVIGSDHHRPEQKSGVCDRCCAFGH